MLRMTTDTAGPGPLLPTMDEVVAGRSAMRLLVSARTGPAVEAIARRVHAAGARADSPFVRFRAGRFPIEPGRLRTTCAKLLDLAAGGTLLVSDIETMPRVVQDCVIELIDALELARTPAVTVRLISGTTLLLFDLVVAGTFSDRLFYRLNVVHVDEAGHADVADRAVGSPVGSAAAQAVAALSI